MKPIQMTATLAALLCSTAVSADVTAQQVWDNWAEQMAVYGQGFSSQGEDMSGDTLTISGVQIIMSDPEATITAELGDIVLTENGDGTVAISVADSYPITLELDTNTSRSSTINLTVEQTGMSLIVSGDPDAMVYDITADRYALSVDSLEGEAASEIDLDIAMFALSNMAGQYSVTEDTLMQISYAFDIGALDIDVLFRENGGTGIVSGSADIAALSMFADIAAPLDMDMEAEMPPFSEGLAFSGGYSFGDLAYAFQVDADGDAASGTATSAGGSLAIAMDLDGVSYTGEARDIEVSLFAPNEVPFPLEASLATYGVNVVVPLSKADDEGTRDVQLAFNFTELEVSPVIWNLFDPAETLPRDPVTVALGLEAQVTPFFDFLDPAQQQAAMMADMPGELNNAQITELTIKGAGAEVTGEGAFTFDNSDLETFDGVPRPEGQMTFALNGVNGLIDNLVSMGLIPEEEVMMPRMMLGMFTTPVGDDMLTSTIEVNSEGHLLANGQRLQ